MKSLGRIGEYVFGKKVFPRYAALHWKWVNALENEGGGSGTQPVAIRHPWNVAKPIQNCFDFNFVYRMLDFLWKPIFFALEFFWSTRMKKRSASTSHELAKKIKWNEKINIPFEKCTQIFMLRMKWKTNKNCMYDFVGLLADYARSRVRTVALAHMRIVD